MCIFKTKCTTVYPDASSGLEAFTFAPSDDAADPSSKGPHVIPHLSRSAGQTAVTTTRPTSPRPVVADALETDVRGAREDGSCLRGRVVPGSAQRCVFLLILRNSLFAFNFAASCKTRGSQVKCAKQEPLLPLTLPGAGGSRFGLAPSSAMSAAAPSLGKWQRIRRRFLRVRSLFHFIPHPGARADVPTARGGGRRGPVPCAAARRPHPRAPGPAAATSVFVPLLLGAGSPRGFCLGPVRADRSTRRVELGSDRARLAVTAPLPLCGLLGGTCKPFPSGVTRPVPKARARPPPAEGPTGLPFAAASDRWSPLTGTSRAQRGRAGGGL